ncbi:conserved hypothetical protein [Verticillium alfalfae VaMs.102]|uniref:Zn(2)-C6 fungal-type domain-containing protein n=1 Tax=Verticillium alfalfae (strain VaMs.102 / ATCC MYA-4576 / FGSC 10136) TaxID=526221 RepID=C9S8H6_VERA1|nr:conserved hypothetical protein [Verticillium alfalfae VaMs.102]EEY13937.1 conserved hypothetical protein [Verticillium alfalfae VaMs.102]
MASASPTPAANCDQAVRSATGSVSPHQIASPKKVTFELLFTETQVRGRLPMRVDIFPHDSTDSIVTTVKNFYGLYSGPTGSRGVSFEDQDGTTLIARYENFRNCMTVYELPLFAPPQMPAATSNPSVSPARRIEHQRPSISHAQQGQNPFTNPIPLQSPQSYNNGFGQAAFYATPASDTRRARNSISHSGQGSAHAGMSGILPTPDPTVGSCMSEEDKDVAIQLMRLGDMSNISHGRTSASTLDDTFSGRADAASSTGATSEGDSDSEEELPEARRQKLDAAGTMRKIYQTTESPFHAFRNATGPHGRRSSLPPVAKARSVTSWRCPFPPGAVDEEQLDLSAQARCQRCRKSKKGCDRQRPCGRCKDAGLSADQCISEDEGNGRKGRYGRHMGVPIKMEDIAVGPSHPSLMPSATPVSAAAAAAAAAADKLKKRKR